MAQLTHLGKVALVTGAASGIGLATALRLAAEGARVCVVDRQAEKVAEAAQTIVDRGGEALACVADVSKPEDNERMVREALARFGVLQLGFLNAGIGRGGAILDGAIEDFDRVIAVNLRGVYLGMRALAAPIIAAGGGAIVATASVAGLRGSRGLGAYCASKHGVIGLVKAAAAEFAERGIRVNAVCPGVIDTPILGPMHNQKEIAEKILGPMHMLGRVGQPEEVAEAVSFLLSAQASFITGVALPVDGGMSSVVAAGRSAERLGEPSRPAVAKP